MESNKLMEQDFLVASISMLSISGSISPPVVARFRSNSLFFRSESDSDDAVQFNTGNCQLFKVGDLTQSLCISEALVRNWEKSYTKGITIEFRNDEESRAFHSAFEQWKKGVIAEGSSSADATPPSSANKFDDKIEAHAAKMYFHYYGQLIHQQNLLQDYVRTGTYYSAVLENLPDFTGRVVVDVGAGTGILSFFAVQAGAKHVYAIEASDMADHARTLIDANPSMGEKITLIKCKVEEVELPEKADVLISEPMGTLLINERMLESYIIARDRLLVPNGQMFPSFGRIHMAPFSDESLYSEIAHKALFWKQEDYYGVNLTSLHGTANQAYFSQPVLDAFDPRILVSHPTSHVIDFTTANEEDLHEIDIPLRFWSDGGSRVHGLACWFDVLFDGSNSHRWLSTGPGEPTTHWYQVRCVLAQPIHVMRGQEITGRLHMTAKENQSYIINLTLSTKMWGPGADEGQTLQTSSGKYDLKDPYYQIGRPQMPQDERPILSPEIQGLVTQQSVVPYLL